jgi:lipopolysaccharide/colanic/teichoic acid biosynthesis glycosyltransferase
MVNPRTGRVSQRAGIAESSVHSGSVAVRRTPPVPSSPPPRVIDIKIPAINGSGFYMRYGKRFIDIVGAAVGLVLCSPIVALFAALTKLDSRGPVLYKAQRLGQGGRPFTFYKLRSMYVGAHESRSNLMHLNQVKGPVFKLFDDPRITRVGRFMRKCSVDELPQLYNVLKGDMSLVGPRPPIPEEVEKYEPWQLRRLSPKPGITCLWQISGRSRLGFDEWMRLDIEYINNQSFLMDMKILLRTVPAVLLREGAY